MRIIILNWRWDTNKVRLPASFKVEPSDDLLYCTGYTKNEFQIISKNFNDKKHEQILFLTHYKEGEEEDDDKKYIKPETIIKEFAGFSKLKIKPFCGTTGSPDVNILYNNGLLHDSKKDFSEFNNKDNECDSERFDLVWDYYWNKLDLEYQKKNLINLWLPLAIDIQGLSEVENDKREIYLKEVLAELDKIENDKSYAEIIIEEWNEIKKILLPESGKEVLDQKYQLNDNEKNRVKFPVDDINPENLKYFVNKNYNDKNNPNFLPNWLKEVVKVIDGKLEQES